MLAQFAPSINLSKETSSDMTSIQPYYLPHLPDYPIFIALYRDVQNADFLRQQLLDGNTEFEYAFLDATRVSTEPHRRISVILHYHRKSLEWVRK